MSTVPEIEAAIEKLSPTEQEELSRWLESRLPLTNVVSAADAWLARARGDAILGVTTNQLMAESRGED